MAQGHLRGPGLRPGTCLVGRHSLGLLGGGVSQGLEGWPRPSAWTDWRDLAWDRCLEGSHFTDGESESWGKGLSLAMQLIPKAQPLGPDILALFASQFSQDGHVSTPHTRAKGRMRCTVQVQVCEPHSQG